MGDTVTLFVDRCVMCTRCVRFTREISGSSELMVIHRGSHEEIDVLQGFPLDNKLAGNVVDLCPVGALGDKDFLYQQRVWFLKQHPGVCTGCSTGCSINVEENQDHVWRLKPRENPHVNKWWMCDDGRYGYHHVHSPDRQIGLRKRSDGAHANIEWATLPAELRSALGSAGRLAAVLSPHLTVEEAFLLSTYVRGIDPQAVIGLGVVPRIGNDETFKNGFTIRAEKAPNRRGVEEVVKHFGGHLTFDAFLADLDQGEIRGAWVTGGYPAEWHDADLAERFADLDLLIVQDMSASALWDAATFQIPGGSFAERDGSYVNHADRLQRAAWAVRPPTGAWVEGPLYWRLLERPGMYNSRRVLDEVASQIPYFAVAGDAVPETGVDLKLNQLAAAQT